MDKKVLLIIVDKILSRRTLNSLTIPLIVLGIQCFFKFLLDKDISYIGISLSAISFGQICPYISYDHLVTNKIVVLKPVYEDGETIPTKYLPHRLVKNEDIDKYKSYTQYMIIATLALFIVTTGLGLKGEEGLHNFFGITAVTLSTLYQVLL